MKKTFIIGVIILVIVIVGIMIFKPFGNVSQTIDGTDIELTGETKEFEIIATNWNFSPSLIEVNKGDKVELHLQSEEGTHGFTILEFGVSETLTPGEDVHTEFIADKLGTFNFFCSVPCGRGHGAMRGLLVVK